MSDAGDEIQVDVPVEVEVSTDAPKGKLSLEDALQVCKCDLQIMVNHSLICSKFSKMPLSMMALLVVCVNAQRPLTNDRPTFACS